jgi:hypothetical protein
VNDGIFVWTVPGGLADGCDYQIRIFRVSDPSKEDYSVNFCIGDPLVSFINPIEGVTWEQGTYFPLKWTSTLGPTELVRIQLWNSEGLYSTLAFTTQNDGLFNWVVPAGVPDGCDYYFKVYLLSDPSQFGTSGIFCFGVPSIYVVTPSQLATWNEGKYWNITWNSTLDPEEDVTIQLFQDGTYVNHLAFSTDNDGVFVWTIPLGTYSYACDYQIRINSNSNPTDFGMSKVFCIDAPASAAFQKDAVAGSTEDAIPDKELMVHPNPAADEITISAFNLDAGDMQLVIYDNFGRKIVEKSYSGIDDQFAEKFDVSSLNKGMYIVVMMNSGQMLKQKFLKN